MPNYQNNYNQSMKTIDETIEQITKKISQECRIKSLKINTNNIIEVINEARISELLLLVARNTAFITIPMMLVLMAFNAPQLINFFPHNPYASEILYNTLLIGLGGVGGLEIFNLQRNNDKFFNKIIQRMSKNTDHVSQNISTNTRYNSSLLSDLNDTKRSLTEYKNTLDTIMTPTQRQNLGIYESGQNQIQDLLNSYSLSTIILFMLNGRLDELTSYDKMVNKVTSNTFNKIQDETDYYRDVYNSYFKHNFTEDKETPNKNPLYTKNNYDNDRKYRFTYEQVINLVLEKVKNNLYDAYEKKDKLAKILNQLTNKIHSSKNPKVIEHLQSIRNKLVRKLNECEEAIKKNEQRFRNLQNSQYANEFITKEKSNWLFSKEMVDELYDKLLTDDILVITQFVHNDILDILPTIQPSYKSSIYQTSVYCLKEIQKHKEEIILKNQQEFTELLNSNTLPRKPANFR